jgi:hypothetical protein
VNVRCGSPVGTAPVPVERERGGVQEVLPSCVESGRVQVLFFRDEL